jgi:hypothetical protein
VQPVADNSACTVTCSDLNSEPYAISENQNRAQCLLYGNKLIISHIAAGKATEMFCENTKVLLFKHEEYK